MIRKRFISLLTNSAHYYLTWALIVLEGDRCRLIVKLRKEILTDALFNTLEDARGTSDRLFASKPALAELQGVRLE